MKIHSRRVFLQGVALSFSPLCELLAASPRKPFFAQVELPIGLQLYTVGSQLEQDFRGNLKSIAAIGYRTVELAGFGKHSPQEWRAALDAVGLKCTSMHVAPRAESGERGLTGDLSRLAADAQVMSASYIVMPSFLRHDYRDPERRAAETAEAYLDRVLSRMTRDDWRRNAQFLNEKGRTLRKFGLRLAYHNHNFEFRPVGGTTGLAILLEETDPELVHFEMDVGWVAAAGHDPLKLLAGHPGRFRLMHVKDIKASTRANFVGLQDGADVGSGTVNWSRLLPAAYSAGVREFFVEQEPPFAVSPMDSVARSFAFLRNV